MLAVLIDRYGGPEVLRLGEYPTPEPAEGELLVRVRATALNRADILQREGKYPPPPGASPIPGLEMAGQVEKLGPGCRRFQPGDRVFALLPGGGYAQYVVVPEAMAMPIPRRLSFEQAAAIPEAFFTAYQALVWIARLQAGEWTLIHAGASGVGTAAIQLARRLCLARPIITAGSKEKIQACLNLGAELGLNYREGPFQQAVLQATGGAGVQVIVDFIGAPYWEQNLNVLAMDGRMVLLAMMGGSVVKQCDLRRLFKKRAQLTASTLRSRSLSYKIHLTQDVEQTLLPRFANGTLQPVIDRVFNWQQVQEAHRYMESNRNIGKIVLTID